MIRKILILVFLAIIFLSFYFAPPIVDKVAQLQNISLGTTFGNVRPQVKKMCSEKNASEKFNEALIESGKDIWGGKIRFIWRSNGTVLLMSAGEDKLHGTSDDVFAVTSCTDPDFSLQIK